LATLRPVRVGLALAVKRGKPAYTTILNNVPIAFLASGGWVTQEMADARIAAAQQSSSARKDR
jgi:hypothetical protein